MKIPLKGREWDVRAGLLRSSQALLPMKTRIRLGPAACYTPKHGPGPAHRCLGFEFPSRCCPVQDKTSLRSDGSKQVKSTLVAVLHDRFVNQGLAGRVDLQGFHLDVLGAGGVGQGGFQVNLVTGV